MSQETFRYSQPLTSAEFGTLLYDICPKGVYRNPNIRILNNSTVEVYGGTYLIYDNHVDSSSGHARNYAVRVANFSELGQSNSVDNPLTANITSSTVSGSLLAISYPYSSTSTSTAVLAIFANRDAVNDAIEGGNGVVVLGTLWNDGGNWSIDTSSQEVIGSNATYPAPYISDFDYDSSTGKLTFNVTNYIQSNKHDALLGASVSISMSGIYDSSKDKSLGEAEEDRKIEKSKGYYFYIDKNGEIKQTDISTPVLGKNILAYKSAGETSFHFIRYRERAEITAECLQVEQPDSYFQWSDTVDNTGYGASVTEQTLYDNAKDSAGQIVLSKLLREITKKLQSLQNQVSSTSRSVSSSLGDKIEYLSSSDTIVVNASNFQVQSKAMLPNATITDATIETLHVTNMGTANDPIENVNMSGTVYINNLTYND